MRRATDRLSIGIYLAGRFADRAVLEAFADQLRNDGYEVTSRWHSEHESCDATDAERCRKYALEDLTDIAQADVFVLVSPRTALPAQGASSGGRHVEFGYALCMGLACCIIGEPENLFHMLPGVRVFRSWSSFREWLRKTA